MGYLSKDIKNEIAELYTSLIDNTPVGIFRSEPKGRVIFCNKAMAKIFGFSSSEEFLAFPVSDIYRESGQIEVFYRLLRKKGSVENYALPLKKQDGTPIWCAVTAKAVCDNKGNISFFDGVLWDITKKKQKGLQDKGLGGISKVFLGTFNDFIFTINLEGAVLDINHAGANSLGFFKDDMVGRYLVEFLGESYRDFFDIFLIDILAVGHREGILNVRGRDGSEHYLDFKACIVREEQAPDYIFFMAQNITNKIKKRKDRLEEERLRGVLEMAGGAAHRLNQPLMVINNLAREIFYGLSPDNADYQKMKVIMEQVDKLNYIIKKIAQIERYEAMEYVAGLKIVDIDRASSQEEGRDR